MDNPTGELGKFEVSQIRRELKSRLASQHQHCVGRGGGISFSGWPVAWIRKTMN